MIESHIAKKEPVKSKNEFPGLCVYQHPKAGESIWFFWDNMHGVCLFITKLDNGPRIGDVGICTSGCTKFDGELILSNK